MIPLWERLTDDHIVAAARRRAGLSRRVAVDVDRQLLAVLLVPRRHRVAHIRRVAVPNPYLIEYVDLARRPVVLANDGRHRVNVEVERPAPPRYAVPPVGQRLGDIALAVERVVGHALAEIDEPPLELLLGVLFIIGRQQHLIAVPALVGLAACFRVSVFLGVTHEIGILPVKARRRARHAALRLVHADFATEPAEEHVPRRLAAESQFVDPETGYLRAAQVFARR